MSNIPALPSLVPGHGLPSHLQGHNLQGRGQTGEFSARWGGDGEEEVGEGKLHSYSSQACLVRRITFNEFLSCSFRCSSTAEKNLKQLQTHDRLIQRVLHFKKMIKKSTHLQTQTHTHILSLSQTDPPPTLPTNVHFFGN